MSTQSEDENSLGDGESYGSGADSVIIEKEELMTPSPETGVNGETEESTTQQPVISGTKGIL